MGKTADSNEFQNAKQSKWRDEALKSVTPHKKPALRKTTFLLPLLFLISAFLYLPQPLESCTSYLWKSHRAPSFLDRAHQLLADNPLIDGHNDLLIRIRGAYGNHIYNANFTEPFENGTLTGETDLERMRLGKYGGAFWSAFWPCPADPFDFSDEAYDPSM